MKEWKGERGGVGVPVCLLATIAGHRLHASALCHRLPCPSHQEERGGGERRLGEREGGGVGVHGEREGARRRVGEGERGVRL
jgi:hypothetical protein